MHVRHGFEFLGYKIKRGSRPMRLPDGKIKSGTKAGALYAYPREKSVQRFKDQIRRLTRRRAPVTTAELIQQINPRCAAGASITSAPCPKTLPSTRRLDRAAPWSHRFRHWRCAGWRELPAAKLYSELGLVNLVDLIPSLAARRKASS